MSAVRNTLAFLGWLVLIVAPPALTFGLLAGLAAR